MGADGFEEFSNLYENNDNENKENLNNFSDIKGQLLTKDAGSNNLTQSTSQNPKIKCAKKYNLPIISLEYFITCLFTNKLYSLKLDSAQPSDRPPSTVIPEWLEIYKNKVYPFYKN